MFSATGRCCERATTSFPQPTPHANLPPPGCASFDTRTLIVLVLATIAACGIPGSGPTMADTPDSEVSVCGALREPLAFWAFRHGAGKVNAGNVAGIAAMVCGNEKAGCAQLSKTTAKAPPAGTHSRIVGGCYTACRWAG